MLAATAQGQLLTYTLTGQPGTQARNTGTAATGITESAPPAGATGLPGLQRSTTLDNGTANRGPALTNTINAYDWTGNTAGNSANAKYYTFAFTTDPAYTVDLTSLTITTIRGDFGPPALEARIFVNGVPTTLSLSSGDATIRTTPNTKVFDLTSSAFDALAGTIEFRIYGIGGGIDTDAYFALQDSVSLVGTATIPEPATVLLTGLGMVSVVGGALLRRRKLATLGAQPA